MIIYYNLDSQQQQFGVKELEKALNVKEIAYTLRGIDSYYGYVDELSLVVFPKGYMENVKEKSLMAESFSIEASESIIYLEGADETGLMYGLLDIAETIKMLGVESIINKIEKPFHVMRGVKFNLPYEPYGGYGDPHEKNLQTCMDISFWQQFIDFLALNRYNCLSLWCQHPFHMMFRLEKYPETSPYTDVELARYKQVFKYIFSQCKKRGIKTYVITWNICVTPQVAKGLNLPEEMGFMTKEHFDAYYKLDEERPANQRVVFDCRQSSPLIKDYLKECIKTLAITYPDLDGVGTNCAEEMTGNSETRHKWVSEPFIQGIEESGRQNFDLFVRTNMGVGSVSKELFVDKYKNGKAYLSWKYSNAHMYSSTAPKFEKLWGAWDNVDLDNTNVVYTLRNDDYYTFRNGCIDFLKAYIVNMKKPYVYGFYWGADAYLWGRNFQHIPHKHNIEKYEFQKHWFQFELIGRLAYNPKISDDVWILKHQEHYGKAYGEEIFKAMRAAGKILPPINRLSWENYDTQWHPESLLSRKGFRTVIDMLHSYSMPGEKTISIKEYAKMIVHEQTTESENVESVISTLRDAATEIEERIAILYNLISKERLCGVLQCTLLDLEAWQEFARYYAYKFEAAFMLALMQETGDEAYRGRAIELLQHALTHWKQLADIWASHYLPYKMVRSQYYFGYTYYIDNVEKDIELAEKYQSDAVYRLHTYEKENQSYFKKYRRETKTNYKA